ncbi:MAG: hypothetical protein QOD73_2280, partial [Solirubrobacteraceae bacterium]|nr:hypothetical protein [Solirubrobacteraceae bacterium]
LPGFIVGGAGIGLTNPPLASTAIGVVAPARSGMASGINSTFRQVGIATGIAGLGALFQQLLQSKVPEALQRVPAEVLATGSPAVVGPSRAAREAYLAAYTSALNDLFLVGAGIAIAGGVLAAALIRQRDFITPQGAARAAASPEEDTGAGRRAA